MDLFAWNSRDALLLAFAELCGYGIVTSGREVDRALAAALRHQGFDAAA
jgi:hypothetical protein